MKKLAAISLRYADTGHVIDRDWVPQEKAEGLADWMVSRARHRGINSPIRVLVYPINDRGNTDLVPDIDEVR